jgi:hypothetical protein
MADVADADNVLAQGAGLGGDADNVLAQGAGLGGDAAEGAGLGGDAGEKVAQLEAPWPADNALDAEWRALLVVVAHPCVMSLLDELWPPGDGGLNAAVGATLAWIFYTYASCTDAVAGVRVRDLATIIVDLPIEFGGGDRGVSPGSLLPGDDHYAAAHAAFLGKLVAAAELAGGRGAPPVRAFAAQTLQVLLAASYRRHRAAMGRPEGAPAGDGGPAWMEPLMLRLSQERPPSLSAEADAAAPKAGFRVGRIMRALTAFNGKTGLRCGLSDVASALACKAIYDCLSDSDGMTLTACDRAAPHNLQPWATYEGKVAKEKPDIISYGVGGITTESCLDPDFMTGLSGAAVCDQYELWFRTVHVLACLWNPDQVFITLGVYTSWIRAMREAAKTLSGDVLLKCVREPFRRAIAAVNTSVGSPQPVIFDVAFDTATLEHLLTISCAVTLASRGPTPVASPSGAGLAGKRKDVEVSLRNQLENQRRENANLKKKAGFAPVPPKPPRAPHGGAPHGGAAAPGVRPRPDLGNKVRGGVDDSPLGACTRVMRSGLACGNNDMCNRCHRAKADWVAQAQR